MDQDKRSELRMWVVVLSVAGLLLVAGAWFALPLLGDGVESLNAGVTLKTAALWAFGVTVMLLVGFAIAAGDSLIGELQFMLAGFFAFFVIITLLIAWIF